MRNILEVVEWMQMNPHWAKQSGAHDWHEFIYVVHGRLHVELAEQELAGETGDVLLVRAGTLHLSDWPADALPQVAILKLRPKLKLPSAHAPKVHDRRGRLLSLTLWAWTDNVEGNRDVQTRDLLAKLFLREHLALSRKVTHESDLVRRAMVYLQAGLTEQGGIPEVLQMMGVSHPTLYRAFMEQLGVSPKQYHSRLKAERALNLLRSTSQPLARIAGEIGLTDPKSVTRLLKRELGLTPSQVRPRRKR